MVPRRYLILTALIASFLASGCCCPALSGRYCDPGCCPPRAARCCCPLCVAMRQPMTAYCPPPACQRPECQPTECPPPACSPAEDHCPEDPCPIAANSSQVVA